MNTTYFMNLVAGNLFGTKKTPAIPSNYYLGLSTTAPNVGGTGVTEPSDSAYARIKLTDLSQPASGVITNNSTLSFAESTTNWGVITHYVIYDAASSGNLLCFGELEHSRTVETETVMGIKPSSLKLSVINPVN